jgi:hypothetical protein
MQAPTTAQIRTAIEVLRKFDEHINHNAANLVIQMPDTQFGDHCAARVEVLKIEQVSVFNPRRNWSTGATNCSKRGGSVFRITFDPGQALPLRAEGFQIRETVAVNAANSHAI